MLPDPTTEIAWAAGFFDGEGCTYKNNKRPAGSFQPAIGVGQMDREVLERLQRALGGLGRIVRHGNPGMWALRITNIRDCWLAHKAMWPFLSSIKRQQAARIWGDWFVAKDGEHANRVAGWDRRREGQRCA